MLRASHIQDGVTNGDQEIFGLAAELSGERGLTYIFNQVLAHQEPKLPRRNPHTATATHDFRRVMAPAGHNTPTTSPIWESRPRLLNTLVFPDERRAVYTDVTQITRSYYDLFLMGWWTG